MVKCPAFFYTVADLYRCDRRAAPNGSRDKHDDGFLFSRDYGHGAWYGKAMHGLRRVLARGRGIFPDDGVEPGWFDPALHRVHQIENLAILQRSLCAGHGQVSLQERPRLPA